MKFVLMWPGPRFPGAYGEHYYRELSAQELAWLRMRGVPLEQCRSDYAKYHPDVEPGAVVVHAIGDHGQITGAAGIYDQIRTLLAELKTEQA